MNLSFNLSDTGTATVAQDQAFVQKELSYYHVQFQKIGYQINNQISSEGAVFYATHITTGNIPAGFVSKFLRAQIGTEIKLMVISKASVISQEQLFDALDEKSNIEILKALLTKINHLDNTFIARVSVDNNVEILKIASEMGKLSAEITPEFIFTKFQTQNANFLTFLLKNYPNFSINLDQLDSIRSNFNLLNACLDLYAGQGNILPLEFLKNLEIYYKNHFLIDEDKESIIAKAIEIWLKTNKMASKDLLEDADIIQLLSDDAFPIIKAKLLSL